MKPLFTGVLAKTSASSRLICAHLCSGARLKEMARPKQASRACECLTSINACVMKTEVKPAAERPARLVLTASRRNSIYSQSKIRKNKRRRIFLRRKNISLVSTGARSIKVKEQRAHEPSAPLTPPFIPEEPQQERTD